MINKDEEIGGRRGMESFVESEYFKNMNIGINLDEGLSTPNDTYSVFWGERVAWWTINYG
jgi:aminoacylase